MSARPYWDYVRTSDLIQIQIMVEGHLTEWGSVFIPIVAATRVAVGFPENQLFSAMRRHGLIVQNLDLSQWSAATGGWIRVTVGANNDFSHLADTGDAAAQAFGELGYSTSGQQAWFLAQVADDITYDETQGYPAITNTITPGQQNTWHDAVQNVPGNVATAASQALNDFADSSAPSWLVIGGIALLAVVVLSSRRGRK